MRVRWSSVLRGSPASVAAGARPESVAGVDLTSVDLPSAVPSASGLAARLAAFVAALFAFLLRPSGLPRVAGSSGALSFGVTSLKSFADSFVRFGTGYAFSTRPSWV